MSEKAVAIDIHDTPPFADLLARVAAGEEIVFEQEGKAVARLVSLLAKPRIAGLHEGQGWTSDDFDAPLPGEFWAGCL
jgi:antitoxin (DNA-binding transcriptional repressor) of toxin-antitoxin stability system